MASPANSVVHNADAADGSADESLICDQENGEDFQGPHPWRQRLRPVPKRIAEIDENDENIESTRADNSPERSSEEYKETAKEEKPNDTRTQKVKLVPSWKRELLEKRRCGPIVARHNNGSAASQIPVIKRRSSALGAESAFTQQVVNSSFNAPGPGVPRKRVSPSNSFRQSGSSSRRNTLTGNDAVCNSEVSKKRIERVQRARLYLLQQNGPNSFNIGGDSPDHKFRVIIGPQTCSCGRGPHCVHVLFVMLRVFQVSENDPCLWSRTLKNYEVENLFRIYHDKRSSLIHSRKEEKTKSQKTNLTVEANPDKEKQESTAASSDSDSGSTKEDEDTCPICLLEMLEGESLIKCENGCHNRLHHHCVAVWFEECRRQSEPLICPLCRAQWKSTTVEIKSTQSENETLPDVPPNTRASSPQTVSESESRLPHAEPIPLESMAIAAPWLQVLGEDLVSCLLSRNWSIRETGLKHLTKEVVATLLRGMGEGRSGVLLSPTRQAATHQMLETCCNVLAYMCADPVYRVFVASLRAMRTMLSYTPCRDAHQRVRLQALLKPIVDAIILKCTDGNRRTSQLSLSTLMELAKSQEGELAVGKEIVDPGAEGLEGLNYVLRCATEEYSLTSAPWQWLLGRLYVLDKVIDEFPNELLPSGVGAESSTTSPPIPDAAGAADSSNETSSATTSDTPNLIPIAKFAIRAVCSTHIRIARMSRRVFLLTAKLGAHFENTVKQLEELLDSVETSAVASLKRKLARIIHDFQVSERIVHELHHGTRKSPLRTVVDSPVPTPDDTPISTPRCNSPVTVVSETGSEFGVPFAPPNTPTHRRKKHKRTLSRKLAKEVEQLLAPPSSPENQRNLQTEPDCSQPQKATIEMGPIVLMKPSARPTSLLDPAAPKESESCHTNDGVVENQSSSPVAPLTDKGNTQTDPSNKLSQSSSPNQQQQQQTGSVYCHFCGQRLPDDDASVKSGTAAAPNTPEKLSRSRYHTAEQESMSSDDFLDPHDSSSPSTSENPVSFKSEVAESPKSSPSHTADQASSRGGDECSCKEEVEREEAEALVKALSVSERQDPCPVVPGLTPTDKEQVITIRIQPEQTKNNNGPSISSSQYPSLYQESIHWVKGPLLGTGAYSTCYQARDTHTGVIMAVKQISFCRNSPTEQEKVVETITEEVHMMARLNHPNVVRILGATRQGCHFNMFVEWMPGGSISYLLGQYGPFSEGVITSYTQQILRGLAYLHDNHILHRDLKGANLLVDSAGRQLRIGDFGAAARLASQATGAGEFQGQLLGTIAFMAPEVLRGENYGRACDVWSVGCVMIEMSTTKPPWNATDISNHLALIFKIASSEDPPPIPENLSPPVRDLLLRCLEQQSEFRPSAKELLMHPLFTQYSNS